MVLRYFHLAIFIFFLTSCSATRYYHISSSEPARIESRGRLICETTPCTITSSCFSSAERDYFTAFSKNKKSTPKYKAVSAPCDVFTKNEAHVFFDIDSIDDGRNEMVKEMAAESRARESQAAAFKAISQSNNNSNKNSANGTNYFTGSNRQCGTKPIPNIGCKIGRCVNGSWEQICDSNSVMTCGLKPVPNIGCRIGRCVDGSWEQICDSNPTLSCGVKPIPNIGCNIGRCIDGQWEEVCN